MIDKKLCQKLIDVRLSASANKQGIPLNITDFAKKLGVSRSAISEVESFKREPSKTVIKKVYEVYKINISLVPDLNNENRMGLAPDLHNENRMNTGRILQKINDTLRNRDRESYLKLAETIDKITNEENKQFVLGMYRTVGKAFDAIEQIKMQEVESLSIKELETELINLRHQNKELQQERDSWREQAQFLKGLLEKKKD